MFYIWMSGLMFYKPSANH